MKSFKMAKKIGNITVFTREGAKDAYRKFLETCFENMSLESTAVLCKVDDDMLKLGFTPEELEEMENDYLSNRIIRVPYETGQLCEREGCIWQVYTYKSSDEDLRYKNRVLLTCIEVINSDIRCIGDTLEFADTVRG